MVPGERAHRINLSRLHHPVTALGPGTRAGVWFQGCTVGCAGCASRDTWSHAEHRMVEVTTVIGWIDELMWVSPLTGITISGGEPFEQPDALHELLSGIEELRSRRGRSDLDVLVFTSHSLSGLRRRYARVIGMIDAVVCGPYVAGRPTRRIWCGSDNQVITPLTDLGRVRYEPFIDREVDRPHLQVAVDESFWMIGIPRPGDLERMEQGLRQAGVTFEQPSWAL